MSELGPESFQAREPIHVVDASAEVINVTDAIVFPIRIPRVDEISWDSRGNVHFFNSETGQVIVEYLEH